MSYTILIVDDSMPMRSVIKRTLKAAGYGSAQILEAQNGQEAIDLMRKSWVDLVMTDYNMPVMNGMDFIRNARDDSVLSQVPVVVVSTEGNEQKIHEFMELGASGYITKPFTAERIRDLIIEILGETDYEQDVDDTDEGLDF